MAASSLGCLRGGYPHSCRLLVRSKTVKKEDTETVHLAHVRPQYITIRFNWWNPEVLTTGCEEIQGSDLMPNTGHGIGKLGTCCPLAFRKWLVHSVKELLVEELLG